jgi:hypothetical protein
MNESKFQQLLHWLTLRLFGLRLDNPACCDNPRQSQQESDHLLLSNTNATHLQNLCTCNMSSVNLLKQSSNNSGQSKQKYYLCEYQYEGGRWSIEIPAESWEDAAARLKRLSYGKVVGEIQATLPVQFGLWAKLWVWLRRWG